MIPLASARTQSLDYLSWLLAVPRRLSQSQGVAACLSLKRGLGTRLCCWLSHCMSPMVAGCLSLSLPVPGICCMSLTVAGSLSLSPMVAVCLSLSLPVPGSCCMSLTVSLGCWLSLPVYPSPRELLHVSHHLPLLLAVSSSPRELLHVFYCLQRLLAVSHVLSRR